MKVTYLEQNVVLSMRTQIISTKTVPSNLDTLQNQYIILGTSGTWYLSILDYLYVYTYTSINYTSIKYVLE